MTKVVLNRLNKSRNYFIFIITLSLFSAISKVSSTIILRENAKFNSFKLASIDGKFTKENMNKDIKTWKVSIHTILPKAPADNENPKERHEFCTIILEHTPILSELLVSQDSSNEGKNTVSKNDEIRYVSAKLPLKMTIFKGELKDCSEYSGKTLEELLSEMNNKMDIDQQKNFLMESFSRLLLQTYDKEYSLEDYLFSSYMNHSLIKEFLTLNVNQFTCRIRINRNIFK